MASYLQRCVVFKDDGSDPEEGTSKAQAQKADRHTERSLEESRKLILEWADELHHVDKVSTRSSRCVIKCSKR